MPERWCGLPYGISLMSGHHVTSSCHTMILQTDTDGTNFTPSTADAGVTFEECYNVFAQSGGRNLLLGTV